MSMQQQIADVVQRYPLSSAPFDGHVWSWLDTGGSGRQVLLLHGSAADAFMFTRTIASLSGQLRLVSVTIPALWEPDRLRCALSDETLVLITDMVFLHFISRVGDMPCSLWSASVF